MLIIEIIKVIFLLIFTICLITFMWYIFYKLILNRYKIFREIFNSLSNKNIITNFMR